MATPVRDGIVVRTQQKEGDSRKKRGGKERGGDSLLYVQSHALDNATEIQLIQKASYLPQN